MKIFNNFTPYEPEGSDLPSNVLFLQSDTGVDWYKAQKEFEKDTLKVMFDSAGVICCAETDVSGLWPVNCSVVEIDSKNLPDDFVVDAGSWVFDGKKITARALSKQEILFKAQTQKARLLDAAATAIAPLQDAVDIGEATEQETALLLAWKKYRVQLNRIDLTLAPFIEWPPVPQ